MRVWVGISLLSLVMCGTALAEDLNAPAQKTPTIATEMQRGHNVTAECIARTQYWDDLSDCVEGAEQLENRNNADTDAFQLGLFGSALVKLTELEQRALDKGDTIGKFMILTGKQWYFTVAELQTKTGVSDRQLSDFVDAFPAKLKAIKEHWASHVLP